MNETNVARHSEYIGFLSLGMTVSRIALAFMSISLLLRDNKKVIVVGIVLVIMALDYYDGKLFRLSRLEEREFWRKIRRIMDSCGDRVCIQAVCISLLVMDARSFIVPYMVICLKEIMTSSICLKNYSRGVIIYPSAISRICTVFVGLTVISYLLGFYWGVLLSTFLLFVGGIISCLSYRRNEKLYNLGCLERRAYETI